MEDRKLLLDLSTDEYIANIRIDGVAYGLLAVDSLGIVERGKLVSLGQSLSGITKAKTAIDESKYDRILLDILCLIMPKAAREALSRLSLMKKLNAVNAYMEAAGLVGKKKARPARMKKAEKLTSGG